ncbi:MAG: F-type H+-transporting ATPase subunit a [Bacteroidia bacterium]|jgi:F-type H+-transporting ATPase subunit a
MFQTVENKDFMKAFGLKKILLFALILCFTVGFAVAQHEESHEDHGKSEEFDAGEMIMHHIADAHEIHFFTLNAGNDNESHWTVSLPVILIGNGGVKVFSSKHLYHGEEVHLEEGHVFAYSDYIMVDEVIYNKDANGEHGITRDVEGSILNSKPLDMSITKTVVGLFLSVFILLGIFIAVGKAYKKRGHTQAPKGLQALIEPLVEFVHEQIIIPSVGSKEKAKQFTPFLLSVFFFIWIANLLGLMSFLGGYNVMGSMSVTLVLAFFVFVITNVKGNKHYWKHIFAPEGVPIPIMIILVPIEALQIFIKPLVLMVRLTANITAGHIIILAFTALIFIFGESSVVAGYGVGVGSLIFMVFMFFIELLVAFLQAYVFTLLSALYFGSAVEDGH